MPLRFWPTWLSAAVVIGAAMVAVGVPVGGSPLPSRAVRAQPPAPMAGNDERAHPEPPRRHAVASSRRVHGAPRAHVVIGVDESPREGLDPDEVGALVRRAGGPVELLVLDGRSGALTRATVAPEDLEGQGSWRWFYTPFEAIEPTEEPAPGTGRTRGARTAR